ncbi:MAG: hypothetical protein ACFFEW_14290 [Candidatus Thorarchaeota archaeon]
MVLLSLLVILVIGISSDAQNQDLPFLSSQQESDGFEFVSIDNATIEEGFMSTCLAVGYTWLGGTDQESLWPHVTLALSMDNSSWITSESHTFDVYENSTRYFRIYNSLFQPFPFDVEPGETLYVKILYGYGPIDLWQQGDYNDQTPCVAVIVESGITRLWYFVIDWRIPGIFGFVIVWIAAVYLMSRLRKAD